MAKWFGKIGYVETKEVQPGVWAPSVTEHEYYGDMIRNTRRYQSAQKVNEDLTISNELSIVADPYAQQHFHAMKYAEVYGSKWTITSVEVQFPRLVLTLGGLYNGATT